MTDDSAPKPRRQHPLERGPAPRPAPTDAGNRTYIRLPTMFPAATYTLIAINALLFVVRALSPSLDEQLYLWGANIPLYVREGEVYRLLASMFLHAGIYGPRGELAYAGAMHILFNMYALYIVGTQLEGLLGWARFVLIYLLGGLAGSVLSAVLNPVNVGGVGASGAVFAIFGAEFVFLYRHRAQLGSYATQRIRSLIILGIINLAYGTLTSVADSEIRIDNWGHIGGLIGGLVLTWCIGPIYEARINPDHPREARLEDKNPLRPRAWILLVYGIVLAAVLLGGFAAIRR